MLVYRVVDKDGDSPYYGNLCDSIGMPCGYSTQHPDPEKDGIGWVNWYEYCGFESLVALYNWFGEWFEELDDAGALVRVYQVPDSEVRKGRKQLVFRLNSSIHVETFTFEEVFDKLMEG